MSARVRLPGYGPRRHPPPWRGEIQGRAGQPRVPHRSSADVGRQIPILPSNGRDRDYASPTQLASFRLSQRACQFARARHAACRSLARLSAAKPGQPQPCGGEDPFAEPVIARAEGVTSRRNPGRLIPAACSLLMICWRARLINGQPTRQSPIPSRRAAPARMPPIRKYRPGP
jgi:hypothetical protein